MRRPSKALQRQVNPRLLTTMNLNNWPGRFYIPSPGVKLANNSDAGPDAGMGMPDWFDLGRKRAVTCLWTEDWFGDSDAQLWSLVGLLMIGSIAFAADVATPWEQAYEAAEATGPQVIGLWKFDAPDGKDSTGRLPVGVLRKGKLVAEGRFGGA